MDYNVYKNTLDKNSFSKALAIENDKYSITFHYMGESKDFDKQYLSMTIEPKSKCLMDLSLINGKLFVDLTAENSLINQKEMLKMKKKIDATSEEMMKINKIVNEFFGFDII